MNRCLIALICAFGLAACAKRAPESAPQSVPMSSEPAPQEAAPEREAAAEAAPAAPASSECTGECGKFCLTFEGSADYPRCIDAFRAGCAGDNPEPDFDCSPFVAQGKKKDSEPTSVEAEKKRGKSDPALQIGDEAPKPVEKSEDDDERAVSQPKLD